MSSGGSEHSSPVIPSCDISFDSLHISPPSSPELLLGDPPIFEMPSRKTSPTHIRRSMSPAHQRYSTSPPLQDFSLSSFRDNSVVGQSNDAFRNLASPTEEFLLRTFPPPEPFPDYGEDFLKSLYAKRRQKNSLGSESSSSFLDSSNANMYSSDDNSSTRDSPEEKVSCSSADAALKAFRFNSSGFVFDPPAKSTPKLVRPTCFPTPICSKASSSNARHVSDIPFSDSSSTLKSEFALPLESSHSSTSPQSAYSSSLPCQPYSPSPLCQDFSGSTSCTEYSPSPPPVVKVTHVRSASSPAHPMGPGGCGNQPQVIYRTRRKTSVPLTIHIPEKKELMVESSALSSPLGSPPSIFISSPRYSLYKVATHIWDARLFAITVVRWYLFGQISLLIY